MTARDIDKLDRLLASFTASMKWSAEATDDEKTLVLGNLNGFVGHLRANGYAEIFDIMAQTPQAGGRPDPHV
jgi:hypothetical protein